MSRTGKRQPTERFEEPLPSTLRARDKKRRQKLRAKLRAEGASEALIEKIIERRRFDDLVARVGLERARELLNAQAHRQDPDDPGYQPRVADPLLTGPARVTGITAKVVRRRDTITRFQYNAVKGRQKDEA